MILLFSFLKNLSKYTINFLFFAQIILLIVVFLVTAYWFWNTIGSDFFSFIMPLADLISVGVRNFYDQDFEIGGVVIDSSILIFDIIALILVYAFNKLKVILVDVIEEAERNVVKYKRIEEDKFNSALRAELESKLKKMVNVSILVEFDVQTALVDMHWGKELTSKQEEYKEYALKSFHASLKDFKDCKLAKTENKMLILLNDFRKTNDLLKFVDNSINLIRKTLKRENWILITYIAVEAYDNKSDLKEVYNTLQLLLDLRIKDEVLCYGNFQMRYELESERTYVPTLKGTYATGGKDNVWFLAGK